MAVAYLIEAPYSQFLDDNGDPLSGGKIFTYAAGTSTPQVTYTDASGTVNAANPIILDSAGRTTIWANVPLKITVTDSSGIQIRTTDNITPTGTVGANSVTNADLAQAPAFTLKGNNTAATANEQDLTVTQVKTLLGVSIYNSISGFIPSNVTGTSTTGTATISAGQATDSGNSVLFTGNTLTFSVSNGNAANGYTGGTTLPNNSTVWLFVIAKTTDTNWSACLGSNT